MLRYRWVAGGNTHGRRVGHIGGTGRRAGVCEEGRHTQGQHGQGVWWGSNTWLGQVWGREGMPRVLVRKPRRWKCTGRHRQGNGEGKRQAGRMGQGQPAEVVACR